MVKNLSKPFFVWDAEWVRPYESLWSIINNVASKNTVSPREALKLVLEDKWINSHTVYNFNRLHYATGIDEQKVLFVLGLSEVQYQNATIVPYLIDWHINRAPHNLVVNALKICPKCLKNSFHTPFFQLHWLHVCPIHNLKLIHQCLDCGAGFSYSITHSSWLTNSLCPSCYEPLPCARENKSNDTGHKQKLSETIQLYRQVKNHINSDPRFYLLNVPFLDNQPDVNPKIRELLEMSAVKICAPTLFTQYSGAVITRVAYKRTCPLFVRQSNVERESYNTSFERHLSAQELTKFSFMVNKAVTGMTKNVWKRIFKSDIDNENWYQALTSHDDNRPSIKGFKHWCQYWLSDDLAPLSGHIAFSQAWKGRFHYHFNYLARYLELLTCNPVHRSQWLSIQMWIVFYVLNSTLWTSAAAIKGNETHFHERNSDRVPEIIRQHLPCHFLQFIKERNRLYLYTLSHKA